MAASNFDIDRAASVLVAACFMTDEEAASKHGLSRRTVANYRNRLETDAELAQLFTSRLKEARDTSSDWLDDLEETIRVAMSAVRRCANELNYKDPESLIALTGALRVLSETHLARRVIDARLALQSVQPGAPNGETPAGFGQPHAHA